MALEQDGFTQRCSWNLVANLGGVPVVDCVSAMGPGPLRLVEPTQRHNADRLRRVEAMDTLEAKIWQPSIWFDALCRGLHNVPTG